MYIAGKPTHCSSSKRGNKSFVTDIPPITFTSLIPTYVTHTDLTPDVGENEIVGAEIDAGLETRLHVEVRGKVVGGRRDVDLL